MNTEQTAEREALFAFIAGLGLTYAVEFVPQSRSRNAKETAHTLNWKVKLSRAGRSLSIDYQQGIGHVPGYVQRYSETNEQREFRRSREKACELGTYPIATTNRYSMFAEKRKPLPQPDLVDVLHCLVLDASVLDSGGFEDWASEYGYDTDSRTAEATYRACLESALQFKAVIGYEALATLAQLFSDANY